MTRKRKMNGSLLRRIISIVGSIFRPLWSFLKLLWNLRKKTISLGFLVIFFGISVPIVVIVNSRPSGNVPTPPPTSDVNPEGQLKNSNELDSEEPKDIQKGSESGTQRTENGNFSKELKDMVERVESGTQHMEDMRESVKSMDEDAKKMIEDVQKMKEKLDGGSED